MRIFLSVLILIFSLQSWTKADDISDIQIEGISIGDSLLDYFSEEEIKKNLERTTSAYNDNKISRIEYIIESKLYESISLHYKNDGSFKIVNVGGRIFYKNINKCFIKMDEVANEIENLLPSANKINEGQIKYSKDPTGKSYSESIIFELENGEVFIACINWSKHIEDKFKWGDHFAVELDSAEFINWLYNEAQQ